MLEKILHIGRKLIPIKLFTLLQPLYHWKLSLLGALVYRFPSRHIKVVAVTGTKGKSTTVELINSILEEAGMKTAVLGTIRFKIGDESERNMRKMTIPGRFFVQKFIRKAVNAKCDWVILEMTSQGVLQSRHKWIAYDALVFTNLSPEHIESHGSYENYIQAKLAIGHQLEKSQKKGRAIIANADDKEGVRFLSLHVPRTIPFSLKDAQPFEKTEKGFAWTFRGTRIDSKLPGEFNLYNMLGAASFAASFGVPVDTIRRAFEKFGSVRGRVEYIREGQNFDVVVDYAHTIDSLEQFYSVFKNTKNICILGNTGGGRDTWKRPKMAHVAEEQCAHIILTNEDPYDEDPQKILDDMMGGIEDKSKAEIIMDRREAIKVALQKADTLQQANHNDQNIAVLITGKGTDPYIMGPDGSKEPWDDAAVVREELAQLHSG